MSDHVPDLGRRERKSLAKLVEECGEAVQVAGKLMAFPDGRHPDGGPHLHLRLQDEIADVLAACHWVLDTLGLDRAEAGRRVAEKTRMFKTSQRAEDRDCPTEPIEAALGLPGEKE